MSETPTPAAAVLAAAARRLWFRDGTKPDLTDPGKAYGRCVIEASALAAAARAKGVANVMLIRATGQNYPGREHWAVIEWDHLGDPADAPITDLTARQFDPAAPVPWTGPLVDWYDVVLDWFNDHIDVEVYAHDPDDGDAVFAIAEDPFWTDRYDREDLEPGPNKPYPWQAAFHAAVDSADMDAEP